MQDLFLHFNLKTFSTFLLLQNQVWAVVALIYLQIYRFQRRNNRLETCFIFYL